MILLHSYSALEAQYEKLQKNDQWHCWLNLQYMFPFIRLCTVIGAEEMLSKYLVRWSFRGWTQILHQISRI